jgi:hypothetical protein
MPALPPPLDLLAKSDARLRETIGPLKSLSPEGRNATPLVEIGERWITRDVPSALGSAFASSLAAIVEAQSRGFPDNLFWDLDYPAAALFNAAIQAPELATERLARSTDAVVALQGVFGMQSPVQFRYAHDFLYGFDWARWVARNEAQRATVGPFDTPFLESMLSRGREILEQIAVHDASYPSLPKGEPRNPFRFQRDPRSEEALHRDLAERGLVPVEAWRHDAAPRWDRPYRALREARASELGLVPRHTSG